MIKKKKNNNALFSAYQTAVQNNDANVQTNNNSTQNTQGTTNTNTAGTLVDSFNYATTNTNPVDVKTSAQYKALVNERTSALSNLNAANMQALKYANNAAQAGGYATQGAAMQNVGNLQSAYLNQVNQVNAGHAQDVANLTTELENKQSLESQKNFQSYQDAVAYYVANGTLTQEVLNDLQSTYLSNVSGKELQDARFYTQNAIEENNKLVEEQKAQEVEKAANEGRYINLTSEINNKQYETSFSNGVKTNKNFTVTINGSTYIVEMGNGAASYLSNTSNQKINDQYKNKKVGEIWEHTSDKGNTVLLVKVGDNDIRVVEKSEKNYDDYEELAKELGYNRDKNIERQETSLVTPSNPHNTMEYM